MTENQTIEYCLTALKKAGADKSSCILTRSKQYELNIASGEVSLLRTTFGTGLTFSAIKDGKLGNIAINKVDAASIDEGVVTVMDLLANTERDDAFDISPYQVPKEFNYGDSEPDMDKMYSLSKNFLNSVKELYPLVNISESILTFTRATSYLANSNGVNFKESRGIYSLQCMFASKDNEKSSSFNYTGCTMKKLENELLDLVTLKTLLKESVEQLDAKPLEGKFVGDIIITPDCLGDFIGFYTGAFLSDSALISGTSMLKDKLNKEVASPKLTLHSNPTSVEISSGFYVTHDGFEAKNMTVIDKGVLKAFLLSLYGANKTKRERSLNYGGAYIVEPGSKSFDEIIKGIKKGLLVARFSGGYPSSNGDFSGVAKNSYYIEDGKIMYPVSETMISGNILEVFKNIKEISSETINFGSSIFPWICSSNVTVSGK